MRAALAWVVLGLCSAWWVVFLVYAYRQQQRRYEAQRLARRLRALLLEQRPPEIRVLRGGRS